MGLARFFDGRFKLWEHLLQLLLVILAIALTSAHINVPGASHSRAETMTIAMSLSGTKFSQHVTRFRKWESPLANMILNILEVIFWLVVAFTKVIAVRSFCQGTNCSLSAIAMVIAFFLFFLCVHVAVVSVLDWRYYKRNKVTQGHYPTVSSCAGEAPKK